MNAAGPDARAAGVAAAIGEPARASMLYSLSDGRARTSTELAAIAGVTPSTASVHLQRLKEHALVSVVAQGKHRYYTLGGPHVATALEALSVAASAGSSGTVATLVATTPHYLRAARTCYDHLAGALGVRVHDRFIASGWLKAVSAQRRATRPGEISYDVTAAGATAFASLGVDIEML